MAINLEFSLDVTWMILISTGGMDMGKRKYVSLATIQTNQNQTGTNKQV